MEVQKWLFFGHVAVERTLSIGKFVNVSGRIEEKSSFPPLNFVHEIDEDDFDRRLQFCEVISESAQNELNVLFSSFVKTKTTFNCL